MRGRVSLSRSLYAPDARSNPQVQSRKRKQHTVANIIKRRKKQTSSVKSTHMRIYICQDQVHAQFFFAANVMGDKCKSRKIHLRSTFWASPRSLLCLLTAPEEISNPVVVLQSVSPYSMQRLLSSAQPSRQSSFMWLWAQTLIVDSPSPQPWFRFTAPNFLNRSSSYCFWSHQLICQL
jgi:hypothetical protein